MKTYWHVYFEQTLERVVKALGLEVLREEELGEMPLKLDLAIIKRDGEAKIEKKPYCYFTKINVIEFKSRDDSFDWEDLDNMGAKAILYKLKNRIFDNDLISLWVISTKFTRNYRIYLSKLGAKLNEITHGIKQGKFRSFSYFVMDLNSLPMEEGYYPFHIFGPERNVRRLIEVILESPELRRAYIGEIFILHGTLLKEVLKLKRKTLKDIDIDYETIIELVGEDNLINAIGEEKLIKKIGGKKTLEILKKMFGKDALKSLIDTKGEQQG